MKDDILSLIGSLAMIVLVLFATYYFTKTISKKITNYSSSKYLKIVDRIVLSQNKSLLIVEIDKKFILLAVSENNISILKELDSLNLELEETNKMPSYNSDVNFLDILKENLLKNKISSKFMHGNNKANKIDKDGE